MAYLIKLTRQPIATELPVPGPCPGCPNPFWHKHGKGTRRVIDREVTTVPTQRYRCRACGKTVTVKPAGVDGTYRSQLFQSLSVVLYSLGLSTRNLELLLQRLGYKVDHATCWRDVQRLAPKIRPRGSPGSIQIMQRDEINAPHTGDAPYVEVVIDLQGRLLHLAVTSADFDWKAWRADLADWGVDVMDTEQAAV